VTEKDNVVALSRYRAQLSRARQGRRAADLFASADPRAAIRALPGDEFFYVVHELGFPDALEVLIHGTPEQIQTALDFAVWDRDQVSLEKADEWLGVLVQAPYETIGVWARGLDVELLALLIRTRARIYDLSLEEAPDEPEGAFANTPDRLFTLDLLGDDESRQITWQLVDSLYRCYPDTARRLLVGMRSELDSELEEMAYRWREGRMADLGFVDFYEALDVYREIDPASVTVGDKPAPRTRPSDEPDAKHARLPAVISDRLSGGGAFARGAAGLSNAAEVADLHFALVALCNRVLSADRVSPGDEQAVTAVLDRVAATLDLAVEFLARGSDERAVAAVRNVPIVRLFQLGTALLGKLRKLARALLKKNPFTAKHASLDLFDVEDSLVLESVARLRPLFPCVLDIPPAGGERPFATLADLAVATSAVERAGASMALLVGLGIRPEHLAPERLASLGINEPAQLDAGLLARTVLVGRLLSLPTSPLRSLSPEAVAEFKKQFNGSPAATETMARLGGQILQDAAPGGRFSPASEAVARRWLESMAPLGPVLIQAG
jgi:hypothetical protein